jgi:hypothetical protein
MELYAGLDLHSRNTYIGIMDKTFNRVFKKMKKGTGLKLRVSSLSGTRIDRRSVFGL